MKKTPTTGLGSRIYSLRYGLGLLATLVLAVYFRFYHLDSLPPGLSSAEAATATLSLGIIHKTQTLSQLLRPGIGQAIYAFLAALSVKSLGTNTYALRLPSAILGTAGVIMTYYWIKSWFGDKTALIAALFVAVTPWTVGLSRVAIPQAGLVLILPGTLWLLTKAARSKQPIWAVMAGFVLAACTTGILGLYFLAGLTASVLPLRALRSKDNKALRRSVLIVLAVSVLIGLPLAVTHFRHLQIKTPNVNLTNLESTISQTSLTLGMFNIRGDGDFLYNIAGTPELNLFVSLMFLVGVLSCFIRFRQARYRIMLILLAVLLIPVIMQPNAPNSLTALILAPVVLGLAAIGTNYMLEVWYSTFPVNSAARTLGTVPIVLLLIISAYQGYKQYFIAWAHSPETYTAYNERATALAGYLNRTSFNGQRYVIAQGQDVDVISFLASGKTNFTVLAPNQLANLPQIKQPQQIIFTTPQPTDILPDLKKRFPKAQLSQHFSEFNDNSQLFAVYQTKP